MDDKKITIYAAMVILLIFLGYIIACTFVPGIDKEIADKTLPWVFSAVGLLLGYYWGSSSGSAAKSETIAKDLEKKE